jgi:DNA polymerase
MCTEQGFTYDPHVLSNMKVSRYMVVGQNPGHNECLKGEPFIGDAGKYFDKCLEEGGLTRDKFYICNAVRCHTLGNEKPNAEQMDRCEPFLRMEIGLLRPKFVVTLGAVAFSVFCPDKNLTPNLGNIVKSEKFDVEVYPIYHPSPRNMNLKERKEKFELHISNLCNLISVLDECCAWCGKVHVGGPENCKS